MRNARGQPRRLAHGGLGAVLIVSPGQNEIELMKTLGLDIVPPRAYDEPLYEQKCSALFEHIFESYPERNNGRLRDGRLIAFTVMTTP